MATYPGTRLSRENPHTADSASISSWILGIGSPWTETDVVSRFFVYVKRRPKRSPVRKEVDEQRKRRRVESTQARRGGRRGEGTKT